MKSKLLYYSKEILLFFVIITLFSNAVSLYKSLDLSKAPFSLKNIVLIDDTKYNLSKMEPTLVHFWATWCPICKIEASNIQSLSQDYNVLSIAVKSGSNEDLDKWLKENNYDFNVLNDTSGLVSSSYNIGVFPTTLIYDKDKNLVFSDVGYTSVWGLKLRMWWASL